MSERIDAHQHFWDLSRPFDYRWLDAPTHEPIRRSYLPVDLEPLLRRCGISRSVFVQTQHCLDENRWVLELSRDCDFIAGVVGWVDLASGDCEMQLEELLGHPKFVGVRHIAQDEPDDDFIVQPDVLRGLGVLQKHGVPFDLLFYTRHLHHAAVVADRFPNLPLVIDHLAKPRIRDEAMADWLPSFREAARRGNVFCKLSGMVTEANWKEWRPTDLRPYVEAALEAFGPERCMFGSDWPVCELAGSYEDVVAALDIALGPLTESDSDKVWGGTARRFYQLGERI